MDAANPYQPPRRASARPSATEPGDGGGLSDGAIQAIATTRLALWVLIVASGLLVLFTLLQFGLAWRYMSRVDYSGNYGVIVFFSMLRGPAAAFCCWQLYSFEQSLRRLVAGGRLKPMLIAQKKVWVTIAVVTAAYSLVLIIGAIYLSATR